MDIPAFLATHRLPATYAAIAQHWFIPVAESIVRHQDSAKRPFVVGINGCQGSGKSTLAAFLAAYLSEHHGLSAVTVSLDDFYLAQTERNALAVKVHPLLATRGVPGTHNISLATSTFDRLGQYGTTSLPRFNKAIDDPYPVTQWPVVNTPCDIVLFEGWCVGAPAQSDAALKTPVNALERDEDPLGIWRRFVNTQLATTYQSWFARIDYLLMLKAPSFRQVRTWREEQEHKLIASLKERGESLSKTMSDDAIARFVQFYQRLTEHCLTELPSQCQQVLYLDDKRYVCDREER
ncbi:P-loop NTPase fold protein [Alteromonas sp. CYL-A6]|uniref:P-loop NTPase fold protein n=1 Tax=Alteromonas nitratireducens TaxID=3390813 RepID=UPI0034B63794